MPSFFPAPLLWLSFLLSCTLALVAIAVVFSLWVRRGYWRDEGRGKAPRHSRVLTGRSVSPPASTDAQIAVFQGLQAERIRLEEERSELRDRLRALADGSAKPAPPPSPVRRGVPPPPPAPRA